MKSVAPETVIVKFKSTEKFKFNVTDHLNEMIGVQVFENVEPLFPDEKDSNLASIYVAKISEGSEISKILDTLNKKKEIDYAHISSERNPY